MLPPVSFWVVSGSEKLLKTVTSKVMLEVTPAVPLARAVTV
ncbi:hypothetical protein [Flavobacterium sp. 3HN19-14]